MTAVAEAAAGVAGGPTLAGLLLAPVAAWVCLLAPAGPALPRSGLPPGLPGAVVLAAPATGLVAAMALQLGWVASVKPASLARPSTGR
jgi:hypothetical protein